MVQAAGVEPATPPVKEVQGYSLVRPATIRVACMVGAVGLEPTTTRLRAAPSTIELRTRILLLMSLALRRYILVAAEGGEPSTLGL